MLFKTRYTLETLESMKAILREKQLDRITAFVSNNTWIFFQPEPRCSSQRLATLFSPLIRITKVSRSKHALLILQPYI